MSFPFKVLKKKDVLLDITQVLLVVNYIPKLDDEADPFVRRSAESW